MYLREDILPSLSHTVLEEKPFGPFQRDHMGRPTLHPDNEPADWVRVRVNLTDLQL